MDTMVMIQVAAGTVVHIGGVPVALHAETVVETSLGNAELLARQTPHESTGAGQTEKLSDS